MSPKQQIQPTKSLGSISQLERFSLGFEYDKTLQFVPPFPSCCEFEDYTIFRNKKKVHFAPSFKASLAN